jgi:hypothetical protein
MVFVALLLLSGGTLLYAGSQAQTTPDTSDLCTLPENYEEASRENNLSLIRLFGLLGGDGVLDREQRNAPLYFQQVQSMRTYYERQTDRLPDCLQSLNNAYIRTLSATQDVLTYNIAMRAYPQQADRYMRKANAARPDLNTEFAVISDFYNRLGAGDGVLP